MARRHFSAMMASVFSFSLLLASAATPVAANHLECNTADPHDVLPANGGRVTVLYESHLLVNPADPNQEQVAAQLVAHLQDRAEAALNRYAELDFPVPPAVTIAIKCRLSVQGTAGLVQIGRDGFTERSDYVQLANDYIQRQFVDAVGNGFAPGSWSSPRAGWASLVDHEMFHTSQHLMAPMGWDYVVAAEKTIMESGAVLAQDFFSDTDDDATLNEQPEVSGSYYQSVQRYFRDPKTIASDTDGNAAYEAAAFFQYLGERFGSQAEPDLEQRVAGWLEELATADGVRIDAMRNAIDPDADTNVVHDALLDFLIAAYVPDHPNLGPEHKILDERIGHGGLGSGSPYPPLGALTTDLGQPVPTQLLVHDEPQAHKINLPAGTVQVGVTFEATGTELFVPGTLYVAVIPIDDGEARIADAQRSLVFPGAQPAARIFQVAGAEELAIFVVSATGGTQYDLTVEDAGGTVAVDILDPTQLRPRPIGSSADPEQLTVEVQATVNGAAADGLTAGAFTTAIDGQAADVLAAVPTGTGRYELLVQPPSGLPDGRSDLSVTFADSAVETETDAIIVGESPGAAVAIVIDNSGSMGGSRIAAAKDASVQFVNDMELGDQIAIVTFSSSASVRQALIELTDETVRQSVISKINAIAAGGGTNLAAGINAGNQQLATAFVGFARAQVFLSDGQDGSDIATAIANTPQDIDIHTIALDTGSNQVRLQQIADGTGGTFFFASDESQLANLYALIRARITDAEFSFSEDLGLIGLGQAQARTIQVLTDLDAVRFGARWIGSDYDLTLTSPTGRVITEANADVDVTVEHGANFVDITITTPEAGAWQASVEGVDLPSGPEPVTLEVEEGGASLRSDLYLTSDGKAGTPLHARFVLTEPAGPVTGADVIATVTDPAGIERVFRLSDEGAALDGGADDGVYAADLWATDLAGSYTVTVNATGTASDGAGFSRVEVASTALSAKVDTDGDGIADGAEAYFGLDPADPSDGAIDLDGDGLTTSQELALGTDPRHPDTDRGEESDGSEVAAGRDPTMATDDQAVPAPVLGVVPKDGNVLSLLARTTDGTGSVELERVTGSGAVDLGSHPGAGTTLDDGPLAPGDYWYSAVAVTAAGAESPPSVVGPFSPAADVTPPSVEMTTNGGAWGTSSRDVTVALSSNETVVEMRLAESEADLEAAAWVAFAATSTFTISDSPGVHVIYAQVRDAASNESRVGSGVVDLQVAVEPTTERVSVSSNRGQANGLSADAYMSDDGRYVVFHSAASNLVAGDTNAVVDAFVHDRADGTTRRVSLSSSGAQATERSSDVAISPDGRLVTFRSEADTLVAGDTHTSGWDIFVHELASGATSMVSRSSAGTVGNASSGDPVLSVDGRYVAFASAASNLVSSDTNGAWDVFVHDRTTGTTSRISVGTSGAQANAGSEDPAISADGRYVTFWSDASSLVAGDTNAKRDIFIHDRATATTTRLSLDSSGAQANGSSDNPSISADGTRVAFDSLASNLVAGDTAGKQDVFVRDLGAGTTVRVSRSAAGVQGDLGSDAPSISADGEVVAFKSSARNLISGDTNNRDDIYTVTLASGIPERVSLSAEGGQANDASSNPAISADGATVSFQSVASNLVPDDTNASTDIFVRGAPY